MQKLNWKGNNQNKKGNEGKVKCKRVSFMESKKKGFEIKYFEMKNM